MKYPLATESWGSEEKEIAKKVIDSGECTMGKYTKQFEKEFAKKMGSKYAIFVNSGSSANLLAVASFFYRKNGLSLKAGDEVIVPAVSWSTTYYPLQQYGLKLKFVDVNLHDFNISIDEIKNAITPATKAIMAVNILGMPCDMHALNQICNDNKLILIEDNCLLPGQKIITDKGLVNIENITTQDKVLTHTGTFKSVLNTMKTENKKTIYDIYSYGGNEILKLTENHPVLLCRTDNILKNKQILWETPNNIKNTDYLMFPRYKEIKNIEKICLKKYDHTCSNSKWKKIYQNRYLEYIDCNNYFLSLIGWYLAEGLTYKNQIILTLGKKEFDNIKNLEDCIQNLKLDYNIKQTKTTTNIIIFNKQLKTFFENEFGTGSKNKKIPKWIIDLPSDKINIILNSYIKGDGCLRKNNKNFFSCTSVSLNLLLGIKLICSKLGYYSSITKMNEAGTSYILGRKVNIKEKYSLRFSISSNEFCNNNAKYKCHIDENYFYIKIKNKKSYYYNGFVYNIEVKDDNSYCNLNCCIHNCESLGATYALDSHKTQCGTFGDVGTTSSFFSHHISTIEGGFCLTDDEELAHIIISLRAHGWLRNLPDKNQIFNKTGNYFEDTFKFVLPGYNVRPNEVFSAIGLEQIKKLDNFVKIRKENHNYLKTNLSWYISLQHSLETFEGYKKDPSWFGFGFITNNNNTERNQIVKRLLENNIECRPIVAGNFTKNPVIKYMNYEICGSLPNATKIDECGFFIGNNPIDLKAEINYFLHILKDVK